MFYAYQQRDDDMDDDDASGAPPITGRPGPSHPTPPHLMAAFQFVALCNNHMGLRCWPNTDGIGLSHVQRLDLHPAQEDAFINACRALSNYFITGAP
jgi:hypothetical protein